MCERLDGGSILALGRSATMIEAALRRNADYVDAGVASFENVALDRADLGDARFERIFAIHVGVFLRERPSRDLEIVRDHLAPGGRLVGCVVAELPGSSRS